jgi:carotenoid 1,2-hydratase
MTERGRGSLRRDATHLSIGPSSLFWNGNALEIDIAEVTFPIPSRFRGRVTVTPGALEGHAFELDPKGRHIWQPVATRAHVAVDFAQPDLRWTGAGYFDSNFGAEPLEAAFSEWQWSRAHRRRDEVVLYEGDLRDGSRFSLGLRFDADGAVSEVEPPPPVALPRTFWRMPRVTRADAPDAARIVRTWEDAPFYARTALATRLFGEEAHGVHESLSLDRLKRLSTRLMVPFRMPRRG